MHAMTLAAGAAILTCGCASFPAHLHASEWGCEVLLCAASSNPSWREVPACHPPMMRLISAMGNLGFDWPTCPEAGTGAPGYEYYKACPEGWSIGYGASDHRGRSEPDLCIKVPDTCRVRLREDDGCRDGVSMARPIRSDPYYFDIPGDDGKVTRHWFSLGQ